MTLNNPSYNFALTPQVFDEDDIADIILVEVAGTPSTGTGTNLNGSDSNNIIEQVGTILFELDTQGCCTTREVEILRTLTFTRVDNNNNGYIRFEGKNDKNIDIYIDDKDNLCYKRGNSSAIKIAGPSAHFTS